MFSISFILKLLKWLVLLFIGFIVFSIAMSIMFGSEQTEDTNNEEVQDLRNEVKKEVSQDTQLYKLDASKLTGLSNTRINLWKSYQDRTLVMSLDGSENVELISRDEVNDYCQIKYNNTLGWLSCEWLVD